MKHVLNVFCLATALCGPSARAEFFTDTGSIIDNSALNQTSGRESKVSDAGRQAGAGMGAAISAGSLLTAAGVRELAALNYAGAARYFGMAGTEFAQAAATASAGAEHGAQYSTLTNLDGQVGAQSQYNSADVAQSLLTPELRQALASQGVNPDSFANQLATGSIRTGSDALTAFGQDVASYSPDDLNWLNDFSGIDMSQFTAQDSAPGDGDRQLLAADESAKPGAGPGGMVAGGAAADAEGANVSDDPTLARLPSVQNGKTVAPKAIAKTSAGDGGAAAFLEGLLGKKNGEEIENARGELRLNGVLQPSRGQNIFKLANRNYRSFNKWRSAKAARQISSVAP